jgi:hypothetical protein
LNKKWCAANCTVDQLKELCFYSLVDPMIPSLAKKAKDKDWSTEQRPNGMAQKRKTSQKTKSGCRIYETSMSTLPCSRR